MISKYSTGVRFIKTLGALEVWSFVGEGVGAVLYLVGAATGSLVPEVLGVACLVVAVLVLRAHLGQPNRSWRAVTRVGSAWVSRGTLVIALFTGFSALSVAAALLDFLAPFGALATGIAVVLAFPVILYAGMMLRSMSAIRLWGGPFVPLSFSAHSAATGLTVAWAIAVVTGQGLATWLFPATLSGLVAAALLSAVHLKTVERSTGTKASLDRLLSGDLRRRFKVEAGLVGLAVPIAALAVVAATGVAPALLAVVAAAARFYGDFAYRLSVVTAGAYEPIWPPQAEYFARDRETKPTTGHA